MNELDFEFLKNKLVDQYGEQLYNKISQAFHSARYETFRVNTLKSTLKEIKDILDINNIPYSLYSGIDNVFIVNDKSKIVLLDIYKEGKIYFQNISTLLAPLILDPKEEDHILDMTAAPGGKTSHIASLTNNKSCITAVELNPLRAKRLKYNLEKLGVTRVTTLVKDARELDDFFRFNKILLDAPCSGSGTVLFNGSDNQHFTDQIIKKCQQRQIALIKKAVKLLPKGGHLLYSTCSLFKEENECVIKAVLNNQIVLEPINIENLSFFNTLPSLNNTITIMPNEYFEGFFIAKLKKL